MQMHRTAVENRLSNVHASSSQVIIEFGWLSNLGSLQVYIDNDKM